MADFERLFILSVPFHNVSFEETVAWATDRMVQRQPGGIVVTPNLDFMYNVSRDRELRRLVYESDLVVADGMPAVWLSGLFGPRLKERVTGSDLTPRLLRVCAERGLSVYAIGGAPGVALKALERVKSEHPGLRIAGTLSPPMGPFEKMDVASIGESVRKAAPHLILIAMGMGKQERLMHWLRHNTDVPLMMGVGGSLDFLAGVQTRSPRWVGRIGLEWVWRMGTDPGRFIRRYFDDGVWLLSVLSRLLRVRSWDVVRRVACRLIGFRRAPCGPEREPAGGAAAGDLLTLPGLETAEQQRAFLEDAGKRDWRIIDLRARDWLNSLELAVLALMSVRKANTPGAFSLLVSDGSVRRQLECVGLLEAPAETAFGVPKGPRLFQFSVLVCAGLIGVGALVALAAGDVFSGAAQRLSFCLGCALLLGYAFCRVRSAYARRRLLQAESVRALTGAAAVDGSGLAQDAERVKEPEELVSEIYGNLLNDAGSGCHAGLAWCSWIKPGAIPGGDFIGCVFKNDRHVDFVMGDVSGKSEVAVLLGAASKYEVVRVVNEHVTAACPHERAGVDSLARMITTAIDRRLIKMGAYLTIGYVRFDFDKSRAEYVWHGAPPFFHWSKASGQVQTVCGQGSAIGFQVRDCIQMETRPFAAGDLLVFCSDGILSQRDTVGESLGTDRVADVIAREGKLGDAQAVLAGIQSLCQQWTGGQPFQDDLACLVTCIQELE